MIVAGYEMHVYCANEEKCANKTDARPASFKSFSGPDRRSCMVVFRKRGWKIVIRDGVEDAICPACVKHTGA